ncbi:hypothetical protein ACXIUS_24020 [Bosea thiooxidans]|nr:hypothetical protein [Bosea sp. (in: a-proteobacteria)]
MTASTHSDLLSLHHVLFDTTVRPVISELAAMQLDHPSDGDYIAFIRNTPSLVAIAARCAQRSQELERFIRLAEASAPFLVREHVSTPQAFAMLSEDATLALALLPARTAADQHSRREHGFALIRAVHELDDPTLESLSRAAFGIEPLSTMTAGAVATNALAHAVASYREIDASHSTATVHHIEDAASLRSFIEQAPDFEGLYRAVQVHARAADRLAESLVGSDLGHEEHQQVAMALEGARLQARIALLRIAMSPAHGDLDRWDKLAAQVIPHPTPQLAATLTLAQKMAVSLREMLAAHPLV